MDVLSILKKMKQDVTGYQVEIDGQRDTDAVPSLFTDVHVIYHVEGTDLKADKVKHAVGLSMEKYCSVTHSLRLDAPISYSVHLQ